MLIKKLDLVKLLRLYHFELLHTMRIFRLLISKNEEARALIEKLTKFNDND